MTRIGWQSWLPIIAMIGVMLIGVAAGAAEDAPLTVEAVGRYLDAVDDITAWRSALPADQAMREEEAPEEREIVARHGFDSATFAQTALRVLTAFAGLALAPDFRTAIEQGAHRAETNPDLTPAQRQEVAAAARQMIAPAEAMAAARERDRAAIAPYLERLDRLYRRNR